MRDCKEEFIEALSQHDPDANVNLSNVPMDDPNRAEIFDSYDKTQRQTKEIISALGGVVNSFGIDYDGIISSVKENTAAYDALVQLSYEWIELWNAKGQRHTDERNVASTRLCCEIAEAINKHDGFITDHHEFASLETSVFRMHKTLVQSATNLFVKVLEEENRSVKAFLNERYCGKVRLPMI